jgi:hypothetical protein
MVHHSQWTTDVAGHTPLYVQGEDQSKTKLQYIHIVEKQRI